MLAVCGFHLSTLLLALLTRGWLFFQAVLGVFLRKRLLAQFCWDAETRSGYWRTFHPLPGSLHFPMLACFPCLLFDSWCGVDGRASE